MSNYQLSAPQKIALGFSIFVFILAAATIVLLTFSNWQSSRPLPITITPNNAYPVDENGTPLSKGAGFATQISQGNDGYSVLSWGNNKMVLFAGARTRVTQTGVELLSGRAYLQLQNNAALSLQGGVVSMSNGSITLDQNRNQIVVHNGIVSSSDGRTADTNKQINYAGMVNITNFDRNNLRNNADWQYLISTVQLLDLAPLSLQDITPPVISNIAPANNSVTTSAELVISGEVNDQNATLFINNIPTSLTNGKFIFSTILNQGENRIYLIVSDQQSNQHTEELIYRYLPEAGVENLDSTPN